MDKKIWHYVQEENKRRGFVNVERKEKLLATQVLLGLLVASQAYAESYTVANKETTGDTLVDNTYTFGGYGNYRFDNDKKKVAGYFRR